MLRVKKRSEAVCCVGHAVLWALIGMKKVALGRSPSLLWPLPLFPPIEFVASLRPICRHKPVFIETSLASFQDLSFPEFGRPLNFRPFHLHKNHTWLYKRRERNLFRPNAVSHATSSCPEFHLSRIYRWFLLEIQISLGEKDCKWSLYNIQKCRRVASNPIWFWEEEEEKTKVATLQGLISPFPFWSCVQSQCRQTDR